MLKHFKRLMHPVRVEHPNVQYAVLLQEQLGGANGELKAAMQYMAQSFYVKEQELKDMLMEIAAEEFNHMEMISVCFLPDAPKAKYIFSVASGVF